MTKMLTYRRRVATAMVSIFFLWQFSALIHFALVTHTLCEHGQIVDAGDHHHTHHNDNDSKHGHHHGSGHGDCDTVAALTAARAMTSQAPPLQLLQIVTAFTETPSEHSTPRGLTEILSISPSNSPPSA